MPFPNGNMKRTTRKSKRIALSLGQLLTLLSVTRYSGRKERWRHSNSVESESAQLPKSIRSK